MVPRLISGGGVSHLTLRLSNWFHVEQRDHLLDLVRGSEGVAALVHVIHGPREVDNCPRHGQRLLLLRRRDTVSHHVLPRVLDEVFDLLEGVLRRRAVLFHVALDCGGVVVPGLLTLQQDLMLAR